MAGAQGPGGGGGWPPGGNNPPGDGGWPPSPPGGSGGGAFPPTVASPQVPPPGSPGAHGPFGQSQGPFAPPPGSPFGQPPPSSPFGAPASSAPFGTAPTSATAGGGGDPRVPGPAHDVDVPALGVPDACACCGGPSAVRVETMGQAQSGRTVERRRLGVPYCARCAQHIRAGGRRGLIIGLIGIAAAVPTPFVLTAAWTYAPWWLVIVAGTLVALGAMAVVGRLWRAPAVAREQGCCVADHWALTIKSFGFGSPVTTLRVWNPALASALAARYGAQPRPAGSRAPSGARWILVPFVALVAGIPSYFGTHGKVHFDNPGAVPLTFDVDDGEETITVPPGGHESMRLPTGEVSIAVQANGQRVDQITGEVDAFGTHVATPFGSGCYTTITTAYGTAIVAGSRSTGRQTGQRWYTLSGVDYVLEPFPRSVSVGRGQTGAVKRRFARLNCASGLIER